MSNLNFYTLSYLGYWNCMTCERPVEPANEDPGDAYKRCSQCGRQTLQWIPPVLKPDSMLATPETKP